MRMGIVTDQCGFGLSCRKRDHIVGMHPKQMPGLPQSQCSERSAPAHETCRFRIVDARICGWRQADSLISIVMISMSSKFPLVHRCLQNQKL